MVRANCRDTLTVGDFDFLIETLVTRTGRIVSLGELLTDNRLRDDLLDHESVFDHLIESPACHNISPTFYFYVLVRRVLLDMGIDDRDLADYISSLLTHFARQENTEKLSEIPGENLRYVTDMLILLQKCTSEQAFAIQAHIGNLALYMTGIFHENVEFRMQRRGSPSLDFYEQIGAAQYKILSHHVLARRHHLDHVYERLADDFTLVRTALNNMTERFLHWHVTPLFDYPPHP
ncbi:MAG: hypothetical protein SGI98_04915 [Verrucomicrobiota bacterium]|nr:hypothetical protein [Verrucomicrobiota bacterium]